MEETITGSGELRIGGEPLAVSFTVPAGRCLPEAVLPPVQHFANQITDLAVARVERAGHRISCAKGCGACCRQLVPISPPEARHLAALVAQLPQEAAAQVRARFQAAQEKVAAAGLVRVGPEEGDREGYRRFSLGYFALGIPCPFLVEESCSIHPDRPLVCREYMVVSPPTACAALGHGGVQKVSLPLRVWSLFSHMSSADGSLDWMPLHEALDHADQHPAPEPDKTGPDYLNALMAGIQAAGSQGQ